MPSSSPPVFRILPTTQHNEWGKLGSTSTVAQFAVASNLPNFHLDETKPYAELWMGTHPTSPSLIDLDTSTTKPLAKHLEDQPHLIGGNVTRQFSIKNGNLPFLFKVLSIRKPLSIQTHPDKSMAEKLHVERPDIYKDPNHKPEMAIALTPFIALCGFLPLPRIASYLNAVPEFAALIPPTTLDLFLNAIHGSIHDQKDALKLLWQGLLMADPLHQETECMSLVSRYDSRTGGEDDTRDLVLALSRYFPGDIGIMCVFMLNTICLQPGEAIYLDSGVPHAYISGDIIECMANSNNVVRAGFTTRLRDIPTLIECSTYVSAEASEHVLKPSTFPANLKPGSSPQLPIHATSVLYSAPAPEFSVLLTRLLPLPSSTTTTQLAGPSISIVTHGRGKVQWGGVEGGELKLGAGDVFFVGAGVEVTFRSENDIEDQTEQGKEMLIFRAFVEARDEEKSEDAGGSFY